MGRGVVDGWVGGLAALLGLCSENLISSRSQNAKVQLDTRDEEELE